MSQMARDFLSRCFAPGETIALLLRRVNPGATTQRVVARESALAFRYQAWIGHENGAGADIYVSANPLRSGSRKRTKENIASIRHLYIDIDRDGEARLARLRASDAVPAPTAILSTSPDKYQILWRVEGFDSAVQEQTLKVLAIAFGGDPACTDCNRLIRLPGFLNRKYDPAPLVTVEYPCNSVWSSANFRLDIGAIHGMILDSVIPSPKRPGAPTHSEIDWALVARELANGKDADRLTRELALRRSDKPNPLYYAQRTVDVASARFWLLEGIRIDDVITMLESRRRFEIPAPHCSARAREIAATACRMIARRKTA